MTVAPVRTRARLGADVAASVALAAFSVAVAVGFARVFSGWSFLTDFAVIAAVGHGTSLVLRRLRAPSLVAIPVLLVAVGWTITALYAPETFTWGLPTSATWDLLSAELSAVREQFNVAVAPVLYGGGWDVLAAIGVGLAVVLADVFAFKAFARAEALVPGGVLFVFVGALGTDRLRIATTVLVVAVGVVTTAVLRSYHSMERSRGVLSALTRLGPAVATTAVLVAVLAGYLGPRLPGADAAPLYETRGRGGAGSTFVSPLVDIRSRLTNQSELDLFVVRSDTESYWRSSALPEFDGESWGLPERELLPASGALAAPAANATELRHQITVTNLTGPLVPTAPDPVEASGPDDLRWVADTATLVTVDGDLDRGDVIDVVSASPRFDEATLRAASSTSPGDPIYTTVPSDLPDIVEETARQVTAGAQSSFEAARLLQAWFQRSDNFTYSTEVQAGHGNSAIEAFLRDRVGYCEQFAGTFAAMMRTLGIPARVAVGFTPGIDLGDGQYQVLGKNAHAWPEVWFDGLGWVLFEPTPNRGAPNADYTGLEPRQETDGQAPTEVTAEQDAPTATTVPLVPSDAQLGDLNIPEEFADPTGADGATSGTGSGSESGLPGWPVVAAIFVLLLVAAPAVVRELRSRGRRHDPAHQVALIWEHSIGSLADAGVPVKASDTPLETARVTAEKLPIVARPVTSLATVVTEATYSAEGAEGYDEKSLYGGSVINNCENWSRQIDRAVNESVPVPRRIHRYFTDWG